MFSLFALTPVGSRLELKVDSLMRTLDQHKAHQRESRKIGIRAPSELRTCCLHVLFIGAVGNVKKRA